MFVRRGSRARAGVFPRWLFTAAVAGAFCLTAYGGDGLSELQPRVFITPRAETAGAVRSRSPANLRLDVKLILVPVSVTDAKDRPVTALPQDVFRLLEDGVEQKIASFSREEGPVSLGILFDASGSMKDRIQASVTALREFFLTVIPGDEFSLVQFNDQARLLSGFTPEPEEIFHKLGFVQPKGRTALLDAIAQGSHQMRLANTSRKVLLILSDGADNNSRYSESEIRRRVLESDLRIYAMGLFHHPRLLQQLAEETGGKALVAQNLSELPDIVKKLSSEIRSQYVLGYSSSNPANDGKYHRVKIELLQTVGAPPLHLSWRRGYYAPGE
jgi:Ca-activated chloride channel family protein